MADRHVETTTCPVCGQSVPAERDGSPSTHFRPSITGGRSSGGGVATSVRCAGGAS